MGSGGYVGMSLCEEIVRDYGRHIVCVCVCVLYKIVRLVEIYSVVGWEEAGARLQVEQVSSVVI